MASTSTLFGAAGEHLVISELLRRDYIAALAPQGDCLAANSRNAPKRRIWRPFPSDAHREPLEEGLSLLQRPTVASDEKTRQASFGGPQASCPKVVCGRLLHRSAAFALLPFVCCAAFELDSSR